MRLKRCVPIKIAQCTLRFIDIYRSYIWLSTLRLGPEGRECSLAGLPVEIQILLASAVQSTGSFVVISAV